MFIIVKLYITLYIQNLMAFDKPSWIREENEAYTNIHFFFFEVELLLLQ